MRRPTYSEIQRKIKVAKESISKNNFSILKPKVVMSDVLGLGILMEELNPLLIDLLNEIRPEHYAGTYPPQRSYEEKIFQSELFAFRWESKRLGCMTYLKFTLRENRLWLISIHQDRVDRKGR
jgi:hypothetical protein